MASDLSQLESSYLNSCKKQDVLPNFSILSSFSKVRHQMQGHCVLEIYIDQLMSSDFPPLIDALSPICLSGISAVDVCQKSSDISLNGEHVLSLLHAVNHKLRLVDLIGWSSWKNILQDVCERGLRCQMLNFQFSPIRKLNMNGNFFHLQTLDLDFSIHLTSFQVNCFSCMPNLMHLSMCATSITNLWTTCAALLKLPSLMELRFQKCFCCFGTGPCPKSVEESSTYMLRKIHSGQLHQYSSTRSPSSMNENILHQNLEYPITETTGELCSDDDSFTNQEMLQRTTEELTNESDLFFSSGRQAIGDWLDEQMSSDVFMSPSDQNVSFNGSAPVPTDYQLIEEVVYSSRGIQNGASDIERIVDPKNSIFVGHESFDQSSSPFVSENLSSDSKISTEDDESSSVNVLNPRDTSESQKLAIKKPIAHNPSPICFEKYYREYMISSLPHLKVLDNLPVKKAEREQAKEMIKKYYEYIPYNRQYKESVVSILQKREVGRSGVSHKRSNTKHPYSRESSHSFTRSLSAAKMCSSPWPHLVQLSKIKGNSMEEIKTFRPRQFEYHPCNPSLMVFGTLDGELVVVNHESQKLIGYLPSAGAIHSILGLCWLKKYPSKLIAGSDNGSLKLYDVRQMSSAVTDRYCSLDASDSFDEFDQLTSVHINSTDEYFLVSGFSNHVALYDIGSGKRLQFLKDLHREHINVVKFSHHSPSIFATASFDQDVKLWDLRQAPSKPCYTASSSRGNVMVCFSPDDHYLLASAVDNEVKQLLAVDGRLHMEFDIASIGSAQNYTRSYYMNGRDYVISGSCEENAVRICCAKTGRRLRDISVEGKGSKYSMFVQSLRGDPYRPFHMSVLAAYQRPCTKSEIIKVNLLATDDLFKEDSDFGHNNTLPRLGG
ncbi:uncharacterized protein M6B38_179240 [Iris pallida]|uniref:DWD hypersensitive to UV-B 1 N-terminal domain-containing protein n=1 Tax=Iris pallida TaxID=29817 RepID=A0AAX6EMM6_IRIPA|nr:uncharacterized protein M6B38_179240 [Iris pallida]